MTIQNLKEEYFTFEITAQSDATATQRELFLDFHEAACNAAKGNLKPTTANDILQANFIVSTKNPNGEIVGQCLLFNGLSDAKKIQDYPKEAKQDGALIITSLAGIKAISGMLELLKVHAKSSNVATLFAKAKASNAYAHSIFQVAGYEAKGPEIMGQDEYESFLYRRACQANMPTQSSGHDARAPV